MSTLTFKSITISNFMGFGSNHTTIDLENKGLFLVSGSNGAGKSTLLSESICFALYGQPYRKIKINELINRNNKKKLFVSITFEINNNLYILSRGLKPNILSLTCNGEELDLLSTKSLTQDEIDKIIGINKDMFKNIISLSLSFNKPFLTLPSADKRLYIENVFNISIFSQMLSIVKKENTELKIRDDINSKAISIMESGILSMRSNIKNIRQTINSFEETKLKEINGINDCINAINTKIESYTRIIKSFNTDFKPDDCLLKDSESDLISHKINLKSYNESLNFYTNNTTCPSCNTLIDSDKREEHIINFKNKIDLIKKEIESTTKVINRTKEILTKYNTDLNTFNMAQRELSYLNKELISYKNRLQDVNNRVLEHISIDDFNADLTSKMNEYTDLYGINQTDKESIRINSIIHTILQDDGIKTFFIRQLLPILNERINHYLQIFELPLLFSFNERLEESIRSLSNYDDDISYYSHSEGEKKKIDLSILLSFLEVTKKISNWSSNILIIDELLDSAVDTVSLDNILECIKRITIENKELAIYIISHREPDNNLFDGKIKINKEDNFSVFSGIEK